MIKAALFDIGNVLVTFDHQISIRKILPRSKVDPEEMRRIIMDLIPPLETGRINTAEFLESACAQFGFTGDPTEFAAAYVDIFELNQPMWDFVRRLREQIPICLFSNTSELHETFIFDRYREFHLFPQGIFSWRIGSMKPDLPIYQAAQALLDVDYREILYIDDLPANIATGRRLGMQAIPYDPKAHAEFLTQIPWRQMR